MTLVRHDQSEEKATGCTGFYRPRRPSGPGVAQEVSRPIAGLTGSRACPWRADALATLAGLEVRVLTSTSRRAISTVAIEAP